MTDKRFFYNILNEFDITATENGARYTFPEAKAGRGRIPYGFDSINTSAADVYGWYGFRFCVKSKGDVKVTVAVTLTDGEYSQSVSLADAGTHSFDCRLEDFDLERARKASWRELHSVAVTFDGEAELASARLVKGRDISVECDVRGREGDVGETLTYTVRAVNCSEKRQTVTARQVIDGWESLIAEISPEWVRLEAGEEADFTVEVRMHDYIPVGAHEVTRIDFIPSEGGASKETVSLYSLRRHPHPMIYYTSDEWAATRAKIDKYAKFRPEYERMKKSADEWRVPEPVLFGERDYCYNTNVEYPLVYTAYMYALTGEEAYAEKVARFLEYYSDPETGYPKRKKGCSQSYVQEGHFTAHVMLAYDTVYNSPAVTDSLRERMAVACRIYMEILDYRLASGHISNWVLSELTGALYCAVMLGDYERIDRFVFGPTGIIDQYRYGALGDGWWYECSLSYNTWVSSIALHTAHLMRRYGTDLIHASIPLAYNKEVRPSHPDRPVKVVHGMVNQRWGGIARGYIRIKDLFDAPLKFLDYRGVMFGVNDSAEKKLTGVHLASTYDLAYTYYRDPAYLSVIATDPAPDPIFGIGDLPESDETDAPYRKCAYSDNIGIVALRSCVDGRDARDELQAVLRYGSHGYAHGHYDRTELLSLMRYGRSFYNPEHVWWGYGHFMYKFYVQSSATKNMVTLDGKMQVPADSKRTLFYVGDGYSAAAVETTAQWAYPPFGGMRYDMGRGLPDQCEYNACDLDSVTAAPHGELTEYTEPIRQIRAMAVTDGYVVIFDYLKGEREHDFDCLWQVKGMKSLTSDGGVKHMGHRGQKSRNVLSDTQFITNCDEYEVTGTSKAEFVTRFGEGADLRGTRAELCEPGELYMDIYTAYPTQSRQTKGFVAEDHRVRTPHDLKIFDGENVVYAHHANPWVIGARRLDLPLSGEGDVTLEITALPVYNEQMYPYRSSQGLFLAGATVEFADGERVTIAELPFETENIDPMHGIGKDQEGGDVIIVGERYADAIPISPSDHESAGRLILRAVDGKRPVRLTGVVGACAFPGDKSQRRITYGIAQHGVTARYVTVIEPHEGEGMIARVISIDENSVEVVRKDGRRERVTVFGIETDSPRIDFERM